MPDVGLDIYRFYRGLTTREAEEGGASPDRFVHFQNVRVGDGGARRRLGSAQVAYPSTDQTAVDLDGTNQYFRVAMDTRIHTLGLYWTWECYVKPDVVNVSQYIFGEASATPTTGLKVRIDGSGQPEAIVTLSDGTAHTMTSAFACSAGVAVALQVTRSAGTITFKQDNAQVYQVSNASATLLCRAPTNAIEIGSHNSTDFFNGKIDYLRAFSIARDNHNDMRLRWTDPRCDYCLYSYTGELDANTWMRDHGRYEAHGKGFNTPTETTAFAVQDAMANGIHGYLDRGGKRRVAYVAGGRVHLV